MPLCIELIKQLKKKLHLILSTSNLTSPTSLC